MNEALNRTLQIGPFAISRGAGTITLGDVENKVSPRSMEVLIYLAENSERIVSSEELLSRFWSSVASDHAIHKAIAELRAAMGDSVRRQRYIKTVPKRGYKLQVAVLSDSAVVIPATPSLGRRVRDAWELMDARQLAVGFCASLVLIALVWVADIEQRGAATDGLVIGVPPFRFESNGIETNRYLVDGLTSTLINDLSMLNSLSVVSLLDNREPSARLPRPVSHVLQGTLIQAEDRLRVIVNLVRAEDGVHEYSGRFDMSEGDLFAIQDTIVSNIVSALEIHLDAEERARMQDWGTHDAMAYDRFMKGEFHNAQFNPADWELAISFYQEAVALDPGFISAYLGMAAAANNLSVYSRIPRKQALVALVADIHREIATLDRENPALESIRAIEMRMAGNEYHQEEALLRQQILSGNPPPFAMAHYALLLIGARLYDEASQFLDKAAEVGPFEISPDEIWSYRVSLLPPEDAIVARKLELQVRPKHIGYLGSVARELTYTGNEPEAQAFIERQRLADSEGLVLRLHPHRHRGVARPPASGQRCLRRRSRQGSGCRLYQWRGEFHQWRPGPGHAILERAASAAEALVAEHHPCQ
jgi:DNA-binding winged helix-turn-helix (wHTH) protein/TolB-like protein